jgi:anti-sigma factor RsiW
VNSPERPIGDDDLQAFVDERLAPERRAAVEAYLAAHPLKAASLASDAEIRAMLRARLAAKGEEPIPSRLRVAHILAERRRSAGQRLRSAAAAAALFAIGSGAGWFANSALRAAPGSLVSASAATTNDAIAAFRTFVVEKTHPVEVRADQEAHLVQWLSRRVGKPLSAPDLTSEGFRLMGGRLLPAGQESAAMFMYDDDAGTRLTLYARAGETAQGTEFRFERQGDVSAFSWIDHDLSYVVAARTDRPRLLAVATAIDRQIRQTEPARL